MTPIVILKRKLPCLWADEEGVSADDPVEEVWWDWSDSVEGVKEGDNEGSSKDESDGEGGSTVGVDSTGVCVGESDGEGGSTVGVDSAGICVGEGTSLSSGAGVGTKGVTSEVGGWIVGDGVGGADVARVFIWTFIPWLQCPVVPQMKYLLPGEESGMVVVPPL